MSSNLIKGALLGRRSALGALTTLAGLGSGTLFAANGPGAETARHDAAALDLDDPRDSLYAFGKIWSGYERPVIGAFHGVMYLRLPGRRALPVFGFTGTGVSQAQYDPAGVLRMKSCETGYFTDLRSGEVLEYWDNPLTGERCEVYHFYDDLLSGTLTTRVPAVRQDGTDEPPHPVMNEGTLHPDAHGNYAFRMPFAVYGTDDLLLQWDYASAHPNPVTPEGWPGYSTGPMITPSEHFLMYASLRETADRDLPTARMRGSFARMSECWPWMRMGGQELRAATLFGRMHSHKGLPGTAEVPPRVLAYMEKHAPEYLTLPVTWDGAGNRRLETWGAFAMDVPPETPGYAWKDRSLRKSGFKGPPTGLGRRGYP